MKAGLGAAVGAVRLVVAAAIILALAYLLSWQILWGGMAGSEAPFHLHLIDWVATTFPNLPWWYPWDGMGVSYREAYPLMAHWIAVAVARAGGLSLEGGAQAVQFSLMPLTALGTYAFFHWRLHRPLAGLLAAVMLLLSPIGWVEWTHFGVYASWVGMVLLMPALIALDAFFFAWLGGDRSWRFRVAGVAYIVLTVALGTVSPHLLAAPLLAAPAYVFALDGTSRRRAVGWLLGAVPLLYASVVVVSAFWLVGELQYLSVVRSHWSGAGTNFDPGRLLIVDLPALLSMHPLRDGNLGDLFSITPAVLIPALLSVPLIRAEPRVRVFTALGLFSVAFLTDADLYRPLFAVPGFAEFGVVAHRPLQLLLCVSAPILGALGLAEAPRVLTGWIAARLDWGRRMRLLATGALPVVILATFAADVYAFADHVDKPGRLAYGPSVYGAPPLGETVPAPGIGCELDCPRNEAQLSALGAAFPSPPTRAELNSGSPQLDMAFHTIAGGGITHSYNDQVIPSRELASWMEQSMLDESGTAVKSQLAQALGIDAVVLSKAQSGRAADYERMGWVRVSTDPLAYVNPRPSGLATQWAGGAAVLVIGHTQASTPALYNFLFERATTGLLPFGSAWLVRGASQYVDDYSASDLSRYAGVILLGYDYHDQAAAWSRMDGYVRGGGHLFVETGWQYVDPDWNVGAAPSVVPVQSLKWTTLDPASPAVVDGVTDPAFGRLTYGGGGWSASVGSLRPGATELVRSGGSVLAASWQLGRGRVLWSGMNLLAHDAGSGSTDEDQFVTQQLAWLFDDPQAGAQAAMAPDWTGSGIARLPLQATVGRTLVLFKESLFPGWSARLETPGGSTPVSLVGSEMDFMLASLDSVPPGSTLVFTYGPTVPEQLSWVGSAATLGMLVLWAVRPEVLGRRRRWLGSRIGGAVGRLGEWGDEDEGHPADRLEAAKVK